MQNGISIIEKDKLTTKVIILTMELGQKRSVLGQL
jgi:hypothetical protein